MFFRCVFTVPDEMDSLAPISLLVSSCVVRSRIWSPRFVRGELRGDGEKGKSETEGLGEGVVEWPRTGKKLRVKHSNRNLTLCYGAVIMHI